jgi:hypothetical protein
VGADVIVVGEIEHSVFDAKWQSGTADIRITRIMKGHIEAAKLQFRYDAISGFSDALPSTIGALNHNLAIVFLAAGTRSPSEQLSFEMYSGDGMDALTMDSPAAEQRVRDELDREPKQASSMSAFLMTLHGDIENQVQASIESMADERESRRDTGVNELLKLDCEGVPYMVKAMSDHRPFLGWLRLPNRAPDAFEAFAQYKPKELLEVISMILSWKTGMGRPDHEELGIDDKESQKIYNYWLIYLANHQGVWKTSGQYPGTCL